MLRVGDKAPDFTLLDEEGRTVRLSDFRGKNIVLFFYPKDMSPGCTREACTFRDYYNEFNNLNTVIIGVNMDPPSKHKKFKEMHNLPFILLSDPTGETIKRYGVGRWLGIILNRVTFIIDEEGIIRGIYKSQLMPKKHVMKALHTIREMVQKK